MEFKVFTFFFLNLLFLFCLINVVRSCLYGEEYGDLIPELATIEVGDELSFNCSLNTHYIDNNKIDVQNIFFEKGLNTRISTNVQILDPYTVQLKIPNASLEYNDNYSCNFQDPETGERIAICHSHAEVGFKPLPVKEFKCVYYYRQKLNCSWIKPYNPITDTKYTLYHYYQGLEDEEKPCHNQSKGDDDSHEHCFWDYNTSDGITLHSDKYFLILYGNNSLGNYSQPFELSLKSIVILPPPRDFRYDASKSTFKWRVPENVMFEENLKHSLIYKIEIIDTKDNKIIDTIYHKITDIIENLYYDKLLPYTTYIFNISCKVDDPSNENWSQVISIRNRTKASAPYFAPNIIQQSFETTIYNNSERNVTIYWEEISIYQQNGPDFEYFIQYKEIYQTDWQNNISTIYPNISLVFKSDIEYLFRIYSKNSMGLSTNHSLFSLPPKKRILWNNDSDTLANMIKVLMFENGRRYEMKWDALNSIKIKNYTVFWCRTINNDKCIHSIRWHTTNRNNFSFPPEDYKIDTIDKVRFGISYNSNDNQTTGIIWAKCNVDMATRHVDNILPQISPIDITSHNVKVHWRLSCEAQREVVSQFKISVCKKSGCQIYFAKKYENQYLIGGLKPNSEYNITVSSPELISQPVPIRVITDIGFPDPPEYFNITTVDDKNFNLEWLAPKSASTIQYYRIDWSEYNSTTSAPWSIRVRNESCNERLCNYSIKLENLEPYTTYSFSVIACNKNDNCSNSTKSYRTGPSRPTLINPPVVEHRGEKLLIRFNAPGKPNGPIDYYHVKIFEGAKVLIEQNYSGHHQVELDFDKCKHYKENNAEYYIQIQAINDSKEGLLSSDYTEKMKIQLQCSNKVLLVLILGVGIFTFLLFLYFLLHHSYRVFKSVKQKNDNFTLNIAMEDQNFKDQYNNKSPNHQNGAIDVNNVSESSLIESDSANANTNNSSNTINDTAIFSSEEIQQPSSNSDTNNHYHLNNNNRNHHNNNNKHSKSSKNYIKFLSNKFCSSDSGVSDMNHHDNLEYFWNQDESKEPFLKSTTPNPIPIANGGNNHHNNSNKFNNSKSAPSSNLPSPEHSHHINHDNNHINNITSRLSPQPNSTSTAAATKQTYVLIPSSSNSKYLPHSHTTNLPDSYNMNQV